MFVLSRKEMYKFDSYTINQVGIPGKQLMENAGRGCSERIKRRFLPARGNVAIFCGSGNNGGDGFVIARYLGEWKQKIVIFFTGDETKMSPETRENYQNCKKAGIRIIKLINISDWQEGSYDLNKYDLIVDAIFGVGLKGRLKGWLIDLIKVINASSTTVVAIDIASGINADTGMAINAVKADYTYTMANYKYGHLLGDGREFSGCTEIIDIGIPASIYDKFPPKAFLIQEEDVIYPVRNSLYHKSKYGRIGVIAGSEGFSGAAIMACRSALRAGGGLITLFHRKGMELIFETQLLEVMTYTIPENNGHIDFDQLFTKLQQMDVLLMGPGMNTDHYAYELLETVLGNWKKPTVLDADALNIISSDPKFYHLLEDRLILPHIGEFARLKQKTSEEIIADEISEVDEFVNQYNCYVLLKSATSLYADKENLIFDISGNDGLATGGSGDVLSGIITSFLGQKSSYKNAALAGSYLLGKTAEKLAEKRKPASIIPSDLIEHVFRY